MNFEIEKYLFFCLNRKKNNINNNNKNLNNLTLENRIKNQ